MSKRWGTALAAFSLWAVIVGVLYLQQRRSTLQRFSEEALVYVLGVQTDLERITQVGIEDVLELVSDVEAAKDNDALARRFRSYASPRKLVSQVRLLGTRGREQLRIERRADGAVVASIELQDKSHRPYFQRASQAAAGEVYVSPIDYNIEFGAIEEPRQTTIRFAAPVFRADKTLRGVVVVNQRASQLIESVERARRRIAGTLMLVHEDNIYVSHPNPSKVINKASLGADHPEVSAWLSKNASGGVLRDGGFITVASEKRFGPRAVLHTAVDEALDAKARDFLPLALGAVVSALLVSIALLAWFRQQRLAETLRREKTLRAEISARQAQLEETQERLVASARLATLSETAATLAHELRNPLGAIVHSAELLRRDSSFPDDDVRLLEIVVNECQRLERSVADFLNLAERPTPRMEAVKLGELVEAVVSLGRHEPDIDEIEIEIDVDNTAPAVQVDPDELRQVVWNLLLNAIRATRRAGGEVIRVKTSAGELEGGDAGVIEIIDQGPGLDAPPRGGSDARGSGLGLIVARGIIARYGGRFDLVNRAGGGACARVVLPVVAITPEV